MTEPHRIPTIEVHPINIVRRAKHQEARKEKKNESPKMGRQKKNLQSKGMEDSPVKELSEMEASKLSVIEFKTMVIRMLKELTDN